MLPSNFQRLNSYIFGYTIGIQVADNKVQMIRYQTRGVGVQDEAVQELTAQLGQRESVSSGRIANNLGPDVTSKEVDWEIGDVHIHFSGGEETLAGHAGEGLVFVITALFRSIIEARRRAKETH